MRLSQLLIIIVILGCEVSIPANDKALAKVNKHVLLQSQLPDWIASDNVQMVDAYIDNWIRKKMMVDEAEAKLPSDINLDELVENYRESLLMNNLELFLTEEMMDTIVTSVELDQYYQEHKDDFLLNEYAAKALYIQCADQEISDQIDEVWDDKNFEEELNEVNLEKCGPVWIDENAWIYTSEITSTLSQELSKKIEWKSGNSYNFQEDSVHYFLKIEEVKKPRDRAPISLVQENIVKLILHQRRKDLMSEYENKLLKEGVSNKKIVLYSSE